MNRLLLVDFNTEYFSLSKQWLEDEELRHLIHAGELPPDDERKKWFESLPNRSDYLIWGVEYFGQPIGVSGLKHVSDGQAEYWGYIGEKTLWGKGIGKLLMSEIIGKAKNLALSKVYLKVRKYNIRAYKMYHKFGFTVESEDADVYCMSVHI